MSELLSYLRQNSMPKKYRKESLQSHQRKMEMAKKMKKRKHHKNLKQINIQIVKNSYLQEKIKEGYDEKMNQNSQKQQMVVVVPYNQFQDLVDIAQKIQRNKTSIKRKLTFIKMGQEPSKQRLPAINPMKKSSLDREKSNTTAFVQNHEIIKLKQRKKTHKKVKKAYSQIENYTQPTQKELSKQQFNDYLTSVKQKLLQSSFHLQNRSSI